MKLTKLQRHTAYILMLAEADMMEYDKNVCDNLNYTNNERTGLCKLIGQMLGDSSVKLCSFPELNKKYHGRGTVGGGYWFSPEDWSERIKLLNQCIKETA